MGNPEKTEWGLPEISALTALPQSLSLAMFALGDPLLLCPPHQRRNVSVPFDEHGPVRHPTEVSSRRTLVPVL